jgi:hypothetical protein
VGGRRYDKVADILPLSCSCPEAVCSIDARVETFSVVKCFQNGGGAGKGALGSSPGVNAILRSSKLCTDLM